jgi:V-type H+-transporting ATPase subunit C
VCCGEHGSACIRHHAGLESYETLGTENVVPRSSEEVQGIDDKDSKLYTVTLFKRSIEDFKMAAREAKFVVKDFTYDAGL